MNSNEAGNEFNQPIDESEQLRTKKGFEAIEDMENKLFDLSQTNPSGAIDEYFSFERKVREFLRGCPELEKYFRDKARAELLYDGERLKQEETKLKAEKLELAKKPNNRLGFELLDELKKLEKATDKIRIQNDRKQEKKGELSKLDHQIGKFISWSRNNDFNYDTMAGYGGTLRRRSSEDPNSKLVKLIRELGDEYFDKLVELNKQTNQKDTDNEGRLEIIKENRRAIVQGVARIALDRPNAAQELRTNIERMEKGERLAECKPFYEK
jgi:hypothetical protein